MKTRRATKIRLVRIGSHRAVVVGLDDNGDGTVQFMRELQRSDLKNGEAVPCAGAIRRKNRLVTELKLSKEALRGLQSALNYLLRGEPTE